MRALDLHLMMNLAQVRCLGGVVGPIPEVSTMLAHEHELQYIK